MHDDARQQERDRQLMEYDRNPFEGYPNKWKDPVFQEWLWGYDVQEEVTSAWGRYERGVFAGTAGMAGRSAQTFKRFQGGQSML